MGAARECGGAGLAWRRGRAEWAVGAARMGRWTGKDCALGAEELADNQLINAIQVESIHKIRMLGAGRGDRGCGALGWSAEHGVCSAEHLI